MTRKTIKKSPPGLAALKTDAPVVEKGLIREIVKRAVAIARANGTSVRAEQQIDLEITVTVAHLNGCPLDLKRLRAAEDFDVVHDVFGLNRHINQKTGAVEAFTPRYHARQAA